MEECFLPSSSVFQRKNDQVNLGLKLKQSQKVTVQVGQFRSLAAEAAAGAS